MGARSSPAASFCGDVPAPALASLVVISAFYSGSVFEINPKYTETEHAVRYFHSALYDRVLAKYGEDKARQLLRMPES
jgi:hypothetical protein